MGGFLPDSGAVLGVARYAPALERQLARLDVLVDWERRDRSREALARMRVDVRPCRALLDALGAPERSLRIVHVAGSKGKGSVSAWIAAGLAAAGRRVGCYASPHVERVNERVTLGGVPIGDEALADALALALDARDRVLAGSGPDREAVLRGTWFDVVTAGAFAAFRAAGVELAVVECGLGGRLDSTNAADGEVAVITGIELEHVAILGDTRAAIAFEKAGIVKPGAHVVSALAESDEAGAVVARAARERGALLRVVRPEPARGLDAANRTVAAAALDALGERGERAADGTPLSGAWLERARPPRLPGRLERRSLGGVPVVLDGAHVPASVALVLGELERDPRLCGRPTAILALGIDKDVGGVLKELGGRVDRVLCTSVGTGPYRPAEEIRRRAEETGVAAETVAVPRAALQRAVELARPDRWVLAIGSLHLVGALRGVVTDANEEPAC